MEESKKTANSLLVLTADIVISHVSSNKIPADQLAPAIEKIYRSLNGVRKTAETLEAAHPVPAVPVKNSIFPDYIVCLEDGKKLKMLKRHLRSHYNLSPAEYRLKWGLPADYPMVAPNYSKQRRRLAQEIGLGLGLGRQP